MASRSAMVAVGTRQSGFSSVTASTIGHRRGLPRSVLKQRADFGRPGVYVLSDVVRDRLADHFVNKDFWSSAAVFVQPRAAIVASLGEVRQSLRCCAGRTYKFFEHVFALNTKIIEHPAVLNQINGNNQSGLVDPRSGIFLSKSADRDCLLLTVGH